ncbi:MAG: HAD family hydrolase [Candidatus Limnocylindria bacterium]
MADLTAARLSSPSAVVFDLDGTLVDTVETRIRAWLAVFAERGIAADRAAVADLIGADGRVVARRIAAAAGQTLTDAEADEIDARSGRIYGELNTDPRPFPGTARVLRELSAREIPWAIATSSRPEQVAASVDALRLDVAPVIVDGGAVTNAKPAPDLLIVACDRLGGDRATCWCVGDATWDMEAATSAGSVAIGVTTGAAAAESLRLSGARFVLKSLRGLVDLLPDGAPIRVA